ncbi:VOC family protein [Zobellella taiwanensis]|jgi:catechol 2,3-dioxygenase-like lactoylglutathione lyase family enzyme|uniref:VOC family virulence protein n=1 Tax=Zobellella taiwanensis TaxID=347535 RepID=A0A2P7QL88_9GAMM|nr:VOC family protein [Zobellella taiwanensis]PSJ38712.1 VOC family virulence protein [Zobellella taiwanensis]
MFKVLGVDHLVLRVRNPQRMLDFYCRILGCCLEREKTDIGLYQLRAGAQLIDLVDIRGPLGGDGEAADQCKANMDHFCLRIEPFEPDALLNYFTLAGVICEPPALRYGAEGEGPSIYLFDPEGNQLELKGPAGAATGDE